MATKMVKFRKQEEETHQMSHGMKLSSQVKKRKFTSSDEETPYSEFYPIIPGDVMSVKEILDIGTFPCHRTWEVLKTTLTKSEAHPCEKQTLFGNELEKVEIDVIRNQRAVRARVDRVALRQQAQLKAAAHLKYLEDLSLKPPDFPVPLRSHTLWEGMAVKLSCTLQGHPDPEVTWYKDGVPLHSTTQPWNYKLNQTYGLNTLEIRRASPEDSGEYKAVARNLLGEAMTVATLLVNSHRGAKSQQDHLWKCMSPVELEADFGSTFSPSFVEEGETLCLCCEFTSTLLPFQQDVVWLKDGILLQASSRAEIHTTLHFSSLTLKGVHKEQEGVYTVCLRTMEGVKEHSAYIYVKDGLGTVAGGPGSPLDLSCSDVNKDYVFLTWKPPSADGASFVEGYYIERCEAGVGEWERCNDRLQKECRYPVGGLKANTFYQFRVRAVNRAGAGRPSKPTEPILTSDPAEPGRTMVVNVFNGKEIIITKDQLEGEVRVPFPPTDVHAHEVSGTYAVVSWREPEPRGREPLTFYVEQSFAEKDSWHLASLDQTVSSPRFTTFDLQKGKAYCFRVRSINKYGVSEPSLPSDPIYLGGAIVRPAPPYCIQALRDTDTSVELLWKEPKVTQGIVGYYLYSCEVGTSNWSTINNRPIKGTRFTVHGLKERSKCVFRVKSVSLGGNSDYSDETEPILVKAALRTPSSPSGIAFLNCTGNEMMIGWRAPASNGGDPVRGYFVDQREIASPTWHEVNSKPVRERVYKVSGLLQGGSYQFRIFATNIVGVGKSSEPSEVFLCEKWTTPKPGPPYDLSFRQVRQGSLVLLWKKPLYEGQSLVTGYLVEIHMEDEGEAWAMLTPEPITDTNFKVSTMKLGKSFSLRVSAVNDAGVGRTSLPSETITALIKPGMKDVEIGVDNDGFIFLAFEAPRGEEGEQVVWSKNYKEAIDAGRADVKSKDNRSTLTFSNPSEEDLGLYTVEMIDQPDISSSYNFTAEDLERMRELSWQVRNPLIALQSPWEVEIMEKGGVRMWLQTEPLSQGAELHLILNDKEISSTSARKINFNKAEGLVEVVLEQLTQEDEGSYTAQLRDGRATNQFTLVLVDDKFKQLLSRSAANRQEWKRKLGPYFLEFLSWSVTEECELIFICKVTNTNKDTCLKWFKDDQEIKQAVYDQRSGVSTYRVPQVTNNEAGVFKAVVSDGRGEDISVLEMMDAEYEKLQQQLSRQCALSASPLEVQCTAGGIKLFCSLKYNLSYLKSSWSFKEKKIDQEARMKAGSNMQKVWIEISNPTESDKGKYTLEMFDGEQKHVRQLDLSGQAFEDAMLEYQRQKQLAIAEKNRARVTKGLPDVVAIKENKSLCLTCYVDGDPAPEMSWLKNDCEIVTGGQYTISRDHKSTMLTISAVRAENSGLYSILVQNKYGNQTDSVTVSVYRHGEKPQAGAVEM